MHRSLGSATLACLLTTGMLTPDLSAQNKLYTFPGSYALAGAGDVNNDGYDDVVVGEPGYGFGGGTGASPRSDPVRLSPLR